ncbi:MAG: ATP-binding cassette domain-containing protein, partial [Rudaea sp.]|nr:ATP-binding cassette domain-containing protein [Rudaea sp.]
MNSDSSTVARLSKAGKRYAAVLALDGIDLDVRRGEVLALLGPNGAGKTTAISLLVGLQQPDSGNATLFDAAPQSLPARRRIGSMLQATSLPETLTVGELIELVR